MQPSEVTAVILAGGQGRRMGGLDKGLVSLAGRPLVAHVAERLRDQVGAMLIVANRNRRRYESLGLPVVPDALPGFQGPLAGFAAGMAAARTNWVQIVPCDAPRLPAGLVSRLGAAVEANGTRAAHAVDADGVHPVICLLERSLLDNLRGELDAGLRQVKVWLAGIGSTAVSFDDWPGTLINCNTAEAVAAVMSE